MLYYASPERESRNNVVFARERSDRGNPEDRSTSQNIPSFRAFGEESPGRVGLLRSERYSNIKSVCFAFPGVCSPVEAGEVARIASRRRGDPA